MDRRILLLASTFALLVGVLSPIPSPVHADGFIDFEDGVDSEVIRSSIPGLQFTTTKVDPKVKTTKWPK